jgi:hypothetical protein
MKTKLLKPQKMWAIVSTNQYNENYLYTGTWMSRKDAIRGHSGEQCMDWEDCRKNGDRVIQVLVSPVKPKKRKKS